MPVVLKADTAVVIQFGPFLDAGDGVALEVGLVTALDNASTGIRIAKNGGALAAREATVTTTVYDAMGLYQVALKAGDVDTEGVLRMIFEESATCLPVWQDFQVVAGQVYDSMVLGTDNLDVELLTATQASIDAIETDAAAILVDVGNVDGIVPAAAGDAMTLAAGAVTDASLAGNMEIVFELDFATNYNQTRDAWVTNYTDVIGSGGWNVGKTGYALTTADWNVGKAGYSLTATTGLGAQTANITGNLSGSVGSNSEFGPTEAEAAVTAVLFTDTDAEPAKGAPGATISLADKIGFLYKAWRNRSTQTATTYSLYNDDATTVDHDATVSDNATTADKGEMTDGP
jgi:hypothetical protein